MMKKSILSKFIAGICAVLASVMVFSVAGCKPDGKGNKLPAGESHGLTLISYTLEVDAGATAPLIVTSALMEDVVWTTSNPAVATVEGEGDFNMACTITAHSVGVATITATSGALYATCTVGVSEPETIVIKKDGYIEAEVALDGKGSTAQLTATSSRKHAIVWESSNPLIASVDANGLVKAETVSGTAEIIARCAQHSNVTSSITVKVGSGEDSSYTLENSFINDALETSTGKWYYWNEFSNVRNAKYVEGVVSFEAFDLKAGANWYNVQLKYGSTGNETDEAGNKLKQDQLYAVSFDLDITKAGHITVNGYVLEVQKGPHHYTIYGTHSATLFEMALGVDGKGCDLVEEDFTVALSNITWTPAQPIQLTAPTFSIDTNNNITITDPNPEGSVGSYTLYLYQNNVKVKSVLLDVNSPVINVKKIPQGTYTAQLVANAANARYTTAPETNATSNNTVVSNTAASELEYDIVYGGEEAARLEPGAWTYWASTWVTFSGKVVGNKASVSFSNNAGFWYDTQLWYVLPDNSTAGTKKKLYTVTVHIENLPEAEGGAITVNGAAHDATGNMVITCDCQEGAYIQILFGKDGQTDKMPIQNAKDVVVYLEIAEKA